MQYECANCGESVAQWTDICPNCGEPVDNETDELRTAPSDDGGTDDVQSVESDSAGDDADSMRDELDSGWGGAGFDGDGSEDEPTRELDDTFSEGRERIFSHPELLVPFAAFQMLAVWVTLGLDGFSLESTLGWWIYLVNIPAGLAYVYAGELAHDTDPDLVAALRHVLWRIPALLGVILLTVIVAFAWILSATVLAFVSYGLAGLYLLITFVPYVFVSLSLLLAYPACVIDRHGPVESLLTSWTVSRGSRGQLFVLWLLLQLILAVNVVGPSVALEQLSLSGDPLVVGVALAPVFAFLTLLVQLSFADIYLQKRPRPDDDHASANTQSTGVEPAGQP